MRNHIDATVHRLMRLRVFVVLVAAMSILAPRDVDASMTQVRGRCWVRCGIISEHRGSGADSTSSTGLLPLVSTVWDDLRYAKSLTGIDFQFLRINRRDDITMDTLIEAYMEIGTTNVSALFGPYRPALVTATQKFGIPYVVVDVTSTISAPGAAVVTSFDTVLPPVRPYNIISVVPHVHDMYDAIYDVLRSMRWENVAIFYEDGTEGVRLIEDLVRTPRVHVGAWKLDDDVTVRDALLQVRHMAMTNIVLMTSRQNSESVLDAALHLSMLSYNYNWFITNMDLDISSLHRYAQTEVNMTTLKLQRNHLPKTQKTTSKHGVPDYAAVYDSLLTLYHGIRQHYHNAGSCQWAGKDHIVQTLSKINDVGATGDLTFRSDGTRQGYVISVNTLTVSGLEQIGIWNSSEPDSAQRLAIDHKALRSGRHGSGRHDAESRRGISIIGKLRVATVLEAPYVMPLPDDDNGIVTETSEIRYHGYVIDMLDALSKRAKFTYTLYAVEDGQRGHKQPDGTWSGLVGQLLNGNASLAVGPLTMTSDRQEVVDFTHVFQTVHLSAVTHRRHLRHHAPRDTSTALNRLAILLHFVRPLSGTVWLLLIVVVGIVGVFLYFVERLGAQHLPIGESTSVEIAKSVGHVFATMFLMSRPEVSHETTGSRSMFGRLTIAVVWCFSLCVVTSYSANMAALLTVSRHTRATVAASGGGKTPVLQRLLTQVPAARWRLVTASGGDASALLHSTDARAFGGDIGALLQNRVRWRYVDSVDLGLASVMEPNAESMFIYDSTVLRHRLNDSICTQLEIAPIYSAPDGVGYAFATPKRSAHLAALNLALSRLVNDGTANTLRRKWFDEGESSSCEKTSGSVSDDFEEALTVDDLGGLFVLFGFVISALLIASIADHCIQRVKVTRNHVISNDRSKRSENHIQAGSMKPTSGSMTACNSAACSYDILQIEPFTDSAIDRDERGSILRTRNCTSLSSAKETNF